MTLPDNAAVSDDHHHVSKTTLAQIMKSAAAKDFYERKYIRTGDVDDLMHLENGGKDEEESRGGSMGAHEVMAPQTKPEW